MPKKKDETVVEPEVIQDKPQAPATPAEQMIAPLTVFDDYLSRFQDYKKLSINGISDKKGFKDVDEKRKEVKRVKIEARKVGESIEGPIRELLGQVVAKKKSYENSFKEIEDHLDAECEDYTQEVKAEEDRIRQEAEARFNKRLDQINTLGAKWNGHTSYKIGEVAITSQEIRTLNDEQFIKITSLMEEEGIKEREQQRFEEERRAEEKRIADAELAKAKEEAEKARLEKEKMEQELADALAALEKEKQERVNAEVERVRLEKEAEAEKARQESIAFSERRNKELVEKYPAIEYDGEFYSYRGFAIGVKEEVLFEHLNEDKWANYLDELGNSFKEIDKDIIEKQQAEEEKRKAEIKAAEEAAVKAEQERVAKEKADAERQEILKPDKEKLLIAAQKIADFPTKLAFTSEEAKSIHNQLIEKMSSISLWLQKETESL